MKIKIKNDTHGTMFVAEVDDAFARILVENGFLFKDYKFEEEKLIEDGFFVNWSNFESVCKEAN